MLLGKIQSGKTRAFLGIIARAFDREFDVAVVLTKGTKTLAGQTVKRIGRDFKTFIDRDEVLLFDIMEAPDTLAKPELRRKIVIVAKKQKHNLERIQDLFDEKYPMLRDRRVLLVDDEADLASVRFEKKKGEPLMDQGTIANQMDTLRATIPSISLSFLQVTATPYALYLQPDNYDEAHDTKGLFYPKKPAFTQLLPIQSGYVGGEDYFGNHGPDDPRHYLYVEVNSQEFTALRTKDERAIRKDRLWTTDNIAMLRRSLVTFLLAVAIRRRQCLQLDQAPQKYAMIIHNDTQRAAHQWQAETVAKLVEMFEVAARDQDERLRNLFDEAYEDLRRSVAADGGYLPTPDECFGDVRDLIADGELNVQRVNSDVQLAPLLNPDTAELKLRTKANVFIGGSILDRGITVPNLVSFYYGRQPRRMQADTVLQHSRMYGFRTKGDLAVTRFYTSRALYDRLSQIQDLESALRQAFENGAEDGAVVFIQSDPSGAIIPCAPSKISLSNVVAIQPNSMFLPTDFDTVAASHLKQAMNGMAKLIPPGHANTNEFVKISLPDALKLLEAISETLVLSTDASFDWSAMKGLLTYYAREANNQVLLLVQEDRRLDKTKSGDRSGMSILGTEALRAKVKEHRAEPAIVLLKQAGGSDLHWKAGPFWWPILASPSQAISCVFATKTAT